MRLPPELSGLDLPDLDGLPGADRVLRGLADYRQIRPTANALLLAALPGRLRDLGLPLPDGPSPWQEPELRLYRTLCDAARGSSPEIDPYFRYNALRREIDSFVAALESRLRRAAGNP